MKLYRSAGLACWLLSAPAAAATLQVGPTRTLTLPSQAAAVAADGDIIEMDAGLYTGDVATWHASHLVLRGVGGMAHLEAAGQNAGGKATWVIQGDDTTVEDVEFSGASVPDQNGAGIRQEGAGLTVRHCSFHDNQEGILAGDNATSDIVIENTEFARNGAGDGYSHNLYINHVRSLAFRFNLSRQAKVGHLLKSRALSNTVSYNWFLDEPDGTASYELDFPNGGFTVVLGNVVQQSATSENGTLLSYGEEGVSNAGSELHVVNNTFINDRSAGTFLRVADGTPVARAVNNLFLGNGTTLSGTATLDHNVTGTAEALVNAAAHDFHLAASAPGINAGVNPGSAQGVPLRPLFQYVDPVGSEARPLFGALDLGAYERAEASVTDAGEPPDAALPEDAGTVSDAGTEGDASTVAEEGDGSSSGPCACSAIPSGGPWLGALAGLALRRGKRKAPAA